MKNKLCEAKVDLLKIRELDGDPIDMLETCDLVVRNTDTHFPNLIFPQQSGNKQNKIDKNQTTMKNLENTIIVKDKDTEGVLLMTSRENFQEHNRCDCYGLYGQQYGCYNAGCYSLDNDVSDIHCDLIQAIEDKFSLVGMKYNDDEYTFFELFPEITNREFSSCEELEEILKDEFSEFDFDIAKIIEFSEKWVKENEEHATVVAWTYHDSHNFKTMILKTEYGKTDAEELEEEDQERILQEFPGVPYIDGVYEEVETEHYIFVFNRCATDPWICSIVEKDVPRENC